MKEEVSYTHCWGATMSRTPDKPEYIYCQVCRCPVDHEDAQLPCPKRELYRYEELLDGSYVKIPRQVERW